MRKLLHRLLQRKERQDIPIRKQSQKHYRELSFEKSRRQRSERPKRRTRYERIRSYLGLYDGKKRLFQKIQTQHLQRIHRISCNHQKKRGRFLPFARISRKIQSLALCQTRPPFENRLRKKQSPSEPTLSATIPHRAQRLSSRKSQTLPPSKTSCIRPISATQKNLAPSTSIYLNTTKKPIFTPLSKKIEIKSPRAQANTSSTKRSKSATTAKITSCSGTRRAQSDIFRSRLKNTPWTSKSWASKPSISIIISRDFATISPIKETTP